MEVELLLLHHILDCTVQHGGVVETLLDYQRSVFLVSNDLVGQQEAGKNDGF